MSDEPLEGQGPVPEDQLHLDLGESAEPIEVPVATGDADEIHVDERDEEFLPAPEEEDSVESEDDGQADEAGPEADRDLDEIDVEDAELAEEPVEAPTAQEIAEPSARRGFYLTPRQTFILIAAVLTVLLVGLTLYLLWLLRPADFTKEGGDRQGGLIPVVAVYGPGRGEKPAFSQPMGVDWSGDGALMYVADARNNRICVFDENGKPVREFGSLGVAKPLEGASRTWDPGELSYPVDVAVGRDGAVYVADFYNDSISVFDEDGKFVRRFPDPYKPTGKGSSGNDGGGIAVTSVAVSGDLVYATDTYQIFVFDTQGNLVRQFGRPGPGPEGLDHPGGIAADRDGQIYVSDSNHNRVVAYSPEGRPRWVTGRPVADLKSTTDNPFVLPRGLSVMPDGSILVADPLGQQLVMLAADGQVIAQYGIRGTVEGQLNFPMDVSVADDLVLIADRQNERAQVVRLSDR